MIKKYGTPISVKCSAETKSLIFELFEKDPRFKELEKLGVVPNPSWFFKFCVNYTLKNLKDESEIKDYAYDSHYVSFLDETIKKFITTQNV